MRNYDRDASGEHLLHRLLDTLFSFRIDRGCGFVHYKNLWVSEDSPCE